MGVLVNFLIIKFMAINFKKLALILMMGLSVGAFAQPVDCHPSSTRSGIFSNVSSSGKASRNEPVTACTVINSLESTDSTTVFFAESSDGDAVLELFYVNEPRYPRIINTGYANTLFPSRLFDDWVDSLSSIEVSLLESRLRIPNRHSDAAVLMTSDALYYGLVYFATAWAQGLNNYNFGVCARGYPKVGESLVNVSITNLGPSKSNVCYQKVGVFFEK